ncbi:hypothetical protein MQE36_09075 [Zhouia spongiae]|uniref:Uncharacterized protein n=1 Tax=Zhouia spongiae TaxID=2202721 RepID=A0ABY3YH44_9FLAO|nr:hypothetical protein [Zhouia spongiae]UNY97249.1 hypothetical protein MQE36_09075 [Zhouia spongiae]
MMKTINIFEPVKRLFILSVTFTGLFLVSCSGDDDGDNNSSFPKEASITYKVTSTTLDAANIFYVNEEGGQDQLTNESLPFTKKITATVERFDVFAISGVHSGESDVTTDIKVEVLVDDKVEDSSNCNSNGGYVNCSAEYVFGGEN